MKKILLFFVISICALSMFSCHRGDEYSSIDISKIEEIHEDAIDNINLQMSNGQDVEAAIDQCIAQLGQSSEVERVYQQEDNIIIKYKSGNYSVIILTDGEQESKGHAKDANQYMNKSSSIPTSSKGDQQITNHKVLIWEPSVDGLSYNQIHTGDQIANIFSSSSINFEINHLKKEQCTISSLTDLTQYGFVYIKAHGCTFKNDQGEDLCWIVTGEKCSNNTSNSNVGEKIVVSVAELYYDNTEQVKKFRKYDPTWGVSNKFISNKVNGVFDSPAVVFVQACHSFDNSSMKNAFIKDKHASAYLGYEHSVTHQFGYEKGVEFVCNMVESHKNALDAWFDIEDNVDNTAIGYILGLFGNRAVLKISSSHPHPTYFAKERYIECPTLNKRWQIYECSFTPYNYNPGIECKHSYLTLAGSSDNDAILAVTFNLSRCSNLSAGTYSPFNVSDTSDVNNWENHNYPMRFLTGNYQEWQYIGQFYMPYASYIAYSNDDNRYSLSSGSVVVQYSNNLRTITFSVTDKNGRQYIGKYEE